MFLLIVSDDLLRLSKCEYCENLSAFLFLTSCFSVLATSFPANHYSQKNVKFINFIVVGGNLRPYLEKILVSIKFLFVLFQGTMHAIIGPTLLDLAYGLSITLSEVSLVFVGQAIGFILGVAIGGINHLF